jgi:hypothetical protein
VARAAHVFAHDDAFRSHVEAVRGDVASADKLASRYMRSGKGRAAIAKMLRKAASWEDRWIETKLANLDRRAYWPEVNRERGDAQRARLDPVDRGIELLARRGAGRCLYCGNPMSNGSGYCRSHRLKPEYRDADGESIKTTARALAEAMGYPTVGPRARRARRTPV